MVDSPSMKPSTTSLESSPLGLIEDSCIPTTTAGKDAADETTCMSRLDKLTKNQSMKMMPNIGSEITTADAHDECKDDTSAITTKREERDDGETSFLPTIATSNKNNMRNKSTKSNTRKESTKSNRFRITESMASMKSKGPAVSTVASTAPVDLSVKKSGSGSWNSPFKGALSTYASKMVSMEYKGSVTIKKEVAASEIKPPSEVLESVDDFSVKKPSLGVNRDEMVAKVSAIQDGVIKGEVKNLSEFDIMDNPPAAKLKNE